MKRGLKNRHLQMIALGGAIGTGLFYGSASTIALAGPAVMLSYLIGGIVICAHVVKVVFMVPLSLTSYWDYIWGDAAPYMLLACTVIGVPLLVCFLVPWITSFKAVRKKMRPATWKKVQRLAYPFMALLVAQGILLGMGHAVYVGADASEFPTYVATSVTYAVMGIAYLVLKLHIRFSSSHAKD